MDKKTQPLTASSSIVVRMLCYFFFTVIILSLVLVALFFSSGDLARTTAESRVNLIVELIEGRLQAEVAPSASLEFSNDITQLKNRPFVLKLALHNQAGKRIAEKSWPRSFVPVSSFFNALLGSQAPTRHSVRIENKQGKTMTLTLHANTADLVNSFRIDAVNSSLPYLAVITTLLFGGLLLSARQNQRQIQKLVGEFNEQREKDSLTYKSQMQAELNAQQLVNIDSLTGLHNRDYVIDYLAQELEKAKKSRRDLVVMLFNLDGFKRIKDALGYKAGDSVLVAAANRLKKLVSEGDMLARLGSDEFILIPHNVVKDEAIALIANCIVQAMGKPYLENKTEIHIGVNIGTARASQSNYDLSDLVTFADIAAHESKKLGRTKFTLFDDNMVKHYQRKIHLASCIPTAIDSNQFTIVYQPKIAVTGKLVGFEALLRWELPALGNIPPSEFVPTAETTGRMRDITQWVIAKVLSDSQSLVAQFGAKLRIALNLSAIDLSPPAIDDLLEQMRGAHGIDAHNIELEVTESAYLENFEDTHLFFNRMAQLGYHISLDDFGTGVSSLNYLTQIQLNTLKIDRQFVQKMEDDERSALIVRSIIDLAKRLKLSTCAEGIETASQFMRLAEAGCDVVQGYWFSRPLNLEDALKLPNQFNDVSRVNKLVNL